MNLLQQFQQHYKQNLSHLFNANTKFILAVSGGIDSVVLVDLFFKTNLNFAIAHCNFMLRNQESLRDEDFVKSLANNYKKDFFVQRFDTENYAQQQKISIQLAARDLRYNWFKQLQTNNNKLQHFLVTAHHSNDNIETVLLNFFRGTGISGLTGIEPVDMKRKIIRPLLPFKKDDIKQYALQQNLLYVEDSSNATNKYTRNSFRNEIIPLVTKHFTNAEENILNNIYRFRDVETIYNEAIELQKQNLIVQQQNEIHIPILKLQKSNALHTIIYEIIKDYGFTPQQISEVEKLLTAHNGSYIQSSTHKIIHNRQWLIISPIEQAEMGNIVIEPTTKFAQLNGKKLLFDYDIATAENIHTKPQKNIEKINADKLEYPLLLRKWKQGDYFYPLGMNKKQKLSKFFINQKLSVIEKENVWVLESNHKIVYVVGYRIDDRYKLTATTKNILQISSIT